MTSSLTCETASETTSDTEFEVASVGLCVVFCVGLGLGLLPGGFFLLFASESVSEPSDSGRGGKGSIIFLGSTTMGSLKPSSITES